MSSDKTSLGDRMKEYEAATRFILPRRTNTIIRVDGRAFHTYLKDAEKPFDTDFMSGMAEVMHGLCAEVSGTVFAYAQSDEISLLIQDGARAATQPWFSGVVQKMCSIAASIATAELNRVYTQGHRHALFDARVYTIPDPMEVVNYFLWRQRDALRNSVSMVAQQHFSPKELHGVNTVEMQDMLLTQRGISWSTDYPVACRQGRICVHETFTEDVSYEDGRTGEIVTASAQRTRWEVKDAPYFTSTDDSWLWEKLREVRDEA